LQTQIIKCAKTIRSKLDLRANVSCVNLHTLFLLISWYYLFILKTVFQDRKFIRRAVWWTWEMYFNYYLCFFIIIIIFVSNTNFTRQKCYYNVSI